MTECLFLTQGAVPTTAQGYAAPLTAFRRSLDGAGFIEGRNVAIKMSGSGLLPCKLTPEPHFAGRKSLL
jgi:hypothetical protein